MRSLMLRKHWLNSRWFYLRLGMDANHAISSFMLFWADATRGDVDAWNLTNLSFCLLCLKYPWTVPYWLSKGNIFECVRNTVKIHAIYSIANFKVFSILKDKNLIFITSALFFQRDLVCEALFFCINWLREVGFLNNRVCEICLEKSAF